MSEPIRLWREGAVAILQLAREDKRNALDLITRAAIAGALLELASDDRVAVIVISGGDKVFAAGADLNLLVDKGAQDVADLDLGQYWATLVRCPKPVIAAVSGVALGAGCELAMMCDLIVADRSARFGQPEVRVGIMPGAGGTQRLLRAVGKPVASLMLMTGETLAAERAAQLGLVSELVEDGPALPRALALAQVIAGMPAKALRAIKRSLALGADHSLEVALALENREFLLLFDTHDKHEGMRAFLDKRTPRYEGK
ncbi:MULTISPECIES: enoyl-CoA hydratase-related protein [unclassified Pseudomonas]|jgi:enoyl-CoA hydratase/carnithine racemase|uniref:enoyl-CoA hydratase-related protein n=1 Tax=Pseudomonas TaxID=286 RepID=UPI0023D891FB|nr:MULTISPECIES: enoyl-CoA hydratase-related protein [unclassified Pseudomonas]GLU39245.1 enoyl-CoA hydratase [Pseudomonas sp. NBRC 100443]